ncbi:GNAT family N-acetyltransferase [Lignipirellula cremea]|uniref:N-acetyltransferase domain-containing protein n=1 Tax=Lignipirellula cremea TaxID=2528010 RepID=A0A518DT51_9BACT|nr:GNAT family N-acetyltransferase [Lignipirellula cremea]QDU95022.1 hypothetical protein Pla8534_28330 [Lignipirellula cremea]
MSQLEIRPVAGGRDQKLFLNLPWKIYKGDPNWIPPLRMEQKELVNYKKHPFYDAAEIQTFLALRDGQPIGRVAAIVNADHNERHKEQLGFIGFFECTNDQEAANGLFDAAKAWFAARDIRKIRGPANPSLNHTVGLLIKRFDLAPTFMMTYNPEYYPVLWETYGFEKVEDLYAYWGHIDMLDTIDEKLRWVIGECQKRFKITLRKVDRKNFLNDVRMFLDIYNKSMVGTWGFVPMSDKECTHMAASLRWLIVPEMTTVAEVDGKPIGVAFGLLDYNPTIKKIDGSLFPFGFLRLLMSKKHIQRVRVISTNVLPEYQRWGVGLLLLSRLVPDVRAWGVKEGEFSWVLESNQLSRGTLERGGAERRQEYRLYDYSF